MEKNFFELSGLEDKIIVPNDYFYTEIEGSIDTYFYEMYDQALVERSDIFCEFGLDIEKNKEFHDMLSKVIKHEDFLLLQEDFVHWRNFYRIDREETPETLSDKIGMDLDYITDSQIISAKSESIDTTNRVYNPFIDANSLFTELYKLKVWDIQGLKKFIKIYGLPTGRTLTNNCHLNETKTLFFMTDLIELFVRLTHYRYIFTLFIALINEDFEQIRYLSLSKYKTYKFIDELKKNLRNSKRETFEFGMDTLTDELNKHNKISQKLRLKKYMNGLQVKPIVQFYDLFDVAYFQLMKALLNNKEFKRCEHCNHYFEVDHESRRFCPPLPFRKRSSCETAYNRNKAKKKNIEG
ncbi:hypothetical protein [Bacillus cytotoxicus]|uniref:hypothetical protein n=1 Tax=Bacillus cytotoxicus TaxID=580165 RepID=UPI003761C240